MEIIEHHQQRVLEAFRRGEFDQIEIIGQADEKQFFELCFKEKMLEALAQGMLTARKKEEVPRCFHLARSRPMVQGSFYLLKRRCGNPNCRCARGELHETWVITRKAGGKGWTYVVPTEERGRLRPLHPGVSAICPRSSRSGQAAGADSGPGGSTGGTAAGGLASGTEALERPIR